MTRIVIDTNVLVAGLRSNLGPSFRILDNIEAKLIVPIVSTPVYLEYEDVLKRPGLIPHLTTEDINDFLDYFLQHCRECKIHFLWRPQLSDPKDDMLLELALAGSADYLVTYNLADFETASRLGINVVTPKQFLSIIGL